jgi:hypothetical protein
MIGTLLFSKLIYSDQMAAFAVCEIYSLEATFINNGVTPRPFFYDILDQKRWDSADHLGILLLRRYLIFFLLNQITQVPHTLRRPNVPLPSMGCNRNAVFVHREFLNDFYCFFNCNGFLNVHFYKFK